MDFILDIAEFLLQAIILLGVFLVAFAGVMALSQRKRGAGEDGTVEARSLNERFEMHEEAVRAVIEDPLESKARGKDQKKEKKAKRKAIKQALKAEDDGEPKMKKQSGYMYHNAQNRDAAKSEIEAENPDMPAKEKNQLITKRLGDMWGRLDKAAQHRYKADAPYVVVKQKGPHKPEPPRLVELPDGTHGKCKRCGEGVEQRAVVIGSRRWKVACFRESTSLEVGDGSHKCKVSGEMIESGEVCLAVKVKSATIYFEASKVAPFLRALLKPALPDALFGGFDALGGRQKQAFYALFPDVALPEQYMSKGQMASSKVAQLPDFAAIVGRPRDTRYDIDDDDSEEDEEPVPAPKKRRVIEDLEDDV